MARWKHTVVRKRVLTRIIAGLQNEISFLEKGASFDSLQRFTGMGDIIPLKVPIRELVRERNNYDWVRKAMAGLALVPGGVTLPEVKGSGRNRVEQLSFPGFIEGFEFVKHQRDVTFWIRRQVMAEMVNPFNGLTCFSEGVMHRTENRYTQRIYELISHWKDKEVHTMSLEKLRDFLMLEDRYPTVNRLLFGLLKPVEEELNKNADTYFCLSTSRQANRVTHVNFAIKTRLSQKKQQEVILMIREQVVNILRMRFGFREEHFKQIRELLADDSSVKRVNEKVGELWSILDSRNGEISNIPAWTLEALLRMQRNEMVENPIAT